MTLDFIHPRAHKGKKHSDNLVAACSPCNVIKGYRLFRNLEDAWTYILRRREELKKEWETRTARVREPAGVA